jgi:hypothetical protein
LSGMPSYLRHIKYEKAFRKLQFKMLTINRYRSVVFSVVLSLLNHGFQHHYYKIISETRCQLFLHMLLLSGN